MVESREDDYKVLIPDIDVLESDYGDNGFLLYAMGLRLKTMDYDSLFINNITDGSDDKKLDFIHLDYDTGVATIAQGYQSEDWSREEPPANKAGDLNTGLNWLLESSLGDIGREEIKAYAEELRDNLGSGDITRVDVFYVHNLKKSVNVENELNTVRRALKNKLERFTSEGGVRPECLVLQVSTKIAMDWRKGQEGAITVRETIELNSTIEPQKIQAPEWYAFVGSVRASELVALRDKYGDALSSANVRDFLGSRETARNINRKIEETAIEEPKNFWVYNNGITLLSNNITIDGNKLFLEGVAIINGAQTTGSLFQVGEKADLDEVQILVRVISCYDQSLIDSVIRYNNTQNPIKAWELRAIDLIQSRIKEDFERLDINYQLRRGTSRARASDVRFEKLGPYLSAFYGQPLAAHKNRPELFESERRYRWLFSEDSDVRNLLFVYSLGTAIILTKNKLKKKLNEATATPDDKAKLGYFRYTPFQYVLLHICAEVIGVWLNAAEEQFERKVTLKDEILLRENSRQELLVKLIETVLGPVHTYLSDRDAYEDFKTQDGVKGISKHAKTIIEQVNTMTPDTYSLFKKNLVILN